MFNIFKKKNKIENQKIEKIDNGIKKDNNANNDINIEKDVGIYTMPKRFLLHSKKSEKAKMTGVLIIVIGAIFIIAISYAMYFYLFKNNEEQKNITPPVIEKSKSPPVKPEKKQDEIINQDIEKKDVNLDENNIATTSDEIKNEIEIQATSTQENIIKTKDSDNDGLFDKEENLFSSDKMNSDSDSDGYSDLSEIMNLYNPTGEGKLTENKNILEYINNKFNYKIYYLKSWTSNSVGGDDSIIFKSKDNHFVQIIVQLNNDNLSIREWHSRQFDDNFNDNWSEDIVDNRKIIKSLDGLIVYFTDANNENIFVLTYNPSVDNILSYKNIFEMMIKSFEFLEN